MVWLGLAIGLVLGGTLGVFLMALVAGRRYTDMEEQMRIWRRQALLQRQRAKDLEGRAKMNRWRPTSTKRRKL